MIDDDDDDDDVDEDEDEDGDDGMYMIYTVFNIVLEDEVVRS